MSSHKDNSRVRNRNAILVLGMMRRGVMGLHYACRRDRKNLRHSTLKDDYAAMNRFNHRLASATLTTQSE